MTITLIGAGNVGYHLGKRLHKKGFVINQVFSRRLTNADFLANKIGAIATDKLTVIDSNSDLYIIAVKDDSIELVSEELSKLDGMSTKLVVHTSGAAASSNISNHFKNYGVFYPLQTFSKDRKVQFSTIPICIDAGRKKDRKVLRKIAKKISNTVAYISDQDRAILHVAAVIVNNFSNHLFHIGQTITEKEQIDFDLLKPLIQETVLKIENFPAIEMQTGPARRNDQKTIKKHLKYLQKFPEYAQLYALLTKNIQDAYRR